MILSETLLQGHPKVCSINLLRAFSIIKLTVNTNQHVPKVFHYKIEFSVPLLDKKKQPKLQRHYHKGLTNTNENVDSNRQEIIAIIHTKVTKR